MTDKKLIRKYTGLTAAVALTACLLFGCTKADVGSSSQNASNAAGSVNQSTVTGSTLAGAGSNETPENASSSSGQTASSAEGTGTQTPQADTGSGQGGQAVSSGTLQNAQNVSGTTTQAESTQIASTPASSTQTGSTPASSTQTASTPAASTQTDSAQGTSTPENTVVVDDSQPQADVQTPEQNVAVPDPSAGYAVESFSGEYEKSDGTESVVIALINDNQISFQFANSGIGSTAPASGSSAIYYGDDGYSISFDVSGDTLGVMVGGDGAEGSVMNGIYYRVLGGDDTIEEEGQDGEEDQEEAWDGDAMDGDLADSTGAYDDEEEGFYSDAQ